MKHSRPIVLILISTFLFSQFIGLSVLNGYVDHELTEETGEKKYKELPAGIQRPDVGPFNALIMMIAAVAIGTLMLLVIIKLKKSQLWKAWYFLAVALSLGVAFAAFVPHIIAGVAAIAAASLKTFRPNFLIHNLTELFIYGGMAVIFVPILNVLFAAILLVLISVYDVFAVRGSKHMIKLARFQAASNMFAGFTIPKSLGQLTGSIKTSGGKELDGKSGSGVAILGGGDIGFPLIFAGTVMTQHGIMESFLIPVFAAIGLATLFLISKKGKFYPAMPFVSAGCFVGYAIVLLI